MGEVDKFLDEQRDDGDFDGDGTFTINFKAAREKLAQFQLADPHEFILKIVQAGNLSAESIRIDLGAKPRITLNGWDQELTIDKIINSLLTPSLGGFVSAEEFLRVGLAVLLLQTEHRVQLTQKIAGESVSYSVQFNIDLTKRTKDIKAINKASTLEIAWEPTTNLDHKKFTALIVNRCIFSEIPIFLGNSMIICRFPKTSGAHRNRIFTSNKTLAASYFHHKNADRPFSPELLSHWKKKCGVSQSFSGLVQISVDQNEMMAVWLTKAGVITDYKEMKSLVPGVSAVVRADKLKTDLTGSSFRDSEALDDLFYWVEDSSLGLVDTALNEISRVTGIRNSLDSIKYTFLSYVSLCLLLGAIAAWVMVLTRLELAPYFESIIGLIGKELSVFAMLLAFLAPFLLYICLVKKITPTSIVYARTKLVVGLASAKVHVGRKKN